jgi:hypothetical protein
VIFALLYDRRIELLNSKCVCVLQLHLNTPNYKTSLSTLLWQRLWPSSYTLCSFLPAVFLFIPSPLLPFDLRSSDEHLRLRHGADNCSGCSNALEAARRTFHSFGAVKWVLVVLNCVRSVNLNPYTVIVPRSFTHFGGITRFFNFYFSSSSPR